MTEPFVEVRARSRFIIFGQGPAREVDTEVWTLLVPAAWVDGVAPGKSSDDLTSRCRQAVMKVNEQWRAEAFAQAERSAAAGGDYDAGHAVILDTEVRRYEPWELERRPWTRGHLRFFYVVDEAGVMREGTEADLPALPPLTPFQEKAFAGWREEQTERWKQAAASYAEALRHAGPDALPSLLSDIESRLARVNERIARLEKAEAEARARAAAAAPPPRVTVDLNAPGPRKSSLGQERMRQSKYAEAIEALRSALEEDLPDDSPSYNRAETLFRLGCALEHEGHLDEAQARVRSALAEHTRRGPRAVTEVLVCEMSLARILARSGPGHAAEARALLDRAASRVRPKRWDQGIHLWAGAVLDHALTRDVARALAALDRAAPMVRGDAIYEPWLARDRARIAKPAD
jgi:tetratricopeptide (TPR) repeat protein